MSMTLLPPLVAGEQKNSKRHWTVDEFYRAAEAGEFADPGRLELDSREDIKKRCRKVAATRVCEGASPAVCGPRWSRSALCARNARSVSPLMVSRSQTFCSRGKKIIEDTAPERRRMSYFLVEVSELRRWNTISAERPCSMRRQALATTGWSWWTRLSLFGTGSRRRRATEK